MLTMMQIHLFKSQILNHMLNYNDAIVKPCRKF